MQSVILRIGTKATLIAAMAMLVSATSFIPAEAAVKAGDRCSREGAKTRIGGDNYVCTKNPRFPKDQRAWIWVGCIEANTLYVDSKKRLDNLKVGLASAQTKLDELVAELPAAEAKAKEFDARIVSTQVKLDSAKANYEENRLKGDAYARATEQWANAVKSYERAIAGFKKAADGWREKSSDVLAQKKRLDLQSQTIAAAEVEISSNLKGRNQACQRRL